jgi:hypothetical protein
LCLNFDITEQRDLLENHDARNMSWNYRRSIHWSKLRWALPTPSNKKTQIDITIRHLPIRWETVNGGGLTKTSARICKCKGLVLRVFLARARRRSNWLLIQEY